MGRRAIYVHARATGEHRGLLTSSTGAFSGAA
jgi:hypothetical protein